MSWLALLKAAIGLISQVATILQEKRLLDAGAAQEVARSFGAAQREVQIAAEVAEDARRKHQQDKTDEAFDKEFQRKD